MARAKKAAPALFRGGRPVACQPVKSAFDFARDAEYARNMLALGVPIDANALIDTLEAHHHAELAAKDDRNDEQDLAVEALAKLSKKCEAFSAAAKRFLEKFDPYSPKWKGLTDDDSTHALCEEFGRMIEAFEEPDPDTGY